MSSRRLSFWANVSLGKYHLGKCLCGQMASRQLSFWANVSLRKYHLGKCLCGQMSSGQMPRILTSPFFLTSSRSCKGHAPLIIQEGRARVGQKVQPCRVGQDSSLDSSIAHGILGVGGAKSFFALTLLHLGAALKCFSNNPVYSFPPPLPTYTRSGNRHAPLLIQKRRAHAGQKVQPRRVGQDS
jgi:hypothetical protein